MSKETPAFQRMDAIDQCHAALDAYIAAKAPPEHVALLSDFISTHATELAEPITRLAQLLRG